MAKSRVQGYPRINTETSRYYGCIDVDKLAQHSDKIDLGTLREIIIEGIEYANKKSSREILKIPEGIDGRELLVLYKKRGKELFEYFVDYCGDPASSAHDCYNKHYSVIAKENFRNRTIQKERMNAGWRYQSIAKDAARLSKRFQEISDLGSKEADFNAVIPYLDGGSKLNIYVSIKNRGDTLGGQDWPKAIEALEGMAISDKNRYGHYLCVFGIAMERGSRHMKFPRNSKTPYSVNTEVWFSDFFWPFFANYSYDEIAKAVLEVIISHGHLSSLDVVIPDEVIDAFGECCRNYGLLNNDGFFNDPYKLVDLFTGKL